MIDALVFLTKRAVLPSAMADDGFVETRIGPVLAMSCGQCQGPDKASVGLRLDSRQGMTRGRKRGPLVEEEASAEQSRRPAVLRVKLAEAGKALAVAEAPAVDLGRGRDSLLDLAMEMIVQQRVLSHS